MFDVEEAAAVKRRIFDKPMENFLRSSKPAAAGGDTMSNAFEVGGFSFNGEASDDKVIAEVISRIVRRIVEMSPTELDLYRYVMEEADRMSDEGEFEKSVLKEAGIKPLEYEEEIEKAQKYSNNRAALDYLNDDVSPDLEDMFGEDQASKIRAKIFRLFVGLNSTVVNEIRKKYAVQYANNCTQNGHYGFAEKWDDVINSIP